MNLMHKSLRFAAAAGVLSAALLSNTASAQGEPVVLRFEHFLPAVSNAQVQVIEPWCNDLAEASAGRIKCEIYPSMQLGGKPSQLNDLVRNGVVDIVWTALGYSPGSFPRSELLDLPYMLPYDGMVASKIIWNYATTYGKDDFADYKLLGLYSDIGGPIHTTEKEIQNVPDLKGVRVRAPTRSASEFLTAVGATPISMPPSQIADSLSKGVIDGAMAGWEVVPPTKLDETTHFHVQPAMDQNAPVLTSLAILMNKDSYARMPDDLKAILDGYSGEALTMRFAKSQYDATNKVEKTMADDPKHTVHTWSPEAYDSLRKKTAVVVDKWLNAQKNDDIDRQSLLEGLNALIRETPSDSAN